LPVYKVTCYIASLVYISGTMNDKSGANWGTLLKCDSVMT